MPQMMPLLWLMYFPFVFLMMNIIFIMINNIFYSPMFPLSTKTSNIFNLKLMW